VAGLIQDIPANVSIVFSAAELKNPEKSFRHEC